MKNLHININKTAQIAGIYVATVIGAGFASGREISLFFLRHGTSGIIGIVLSSLLLGIISLWAILKGMATGKTRLGEALGITAGRKYGTAAEILIGSFTFCIFCVMIAGIAETMSMTLSIGRRPMLLLSGAVCCMILLGNLKALVSFNTLATPILFIGIISACVVILTSYQSQSAVKLAEIRIDNIAGGIDSILLKGGWLLSAIAYASYNALSLISVLCEASLITGSGGRSSKNTAYASIVAGTVILCVLAVMLCFALFNVPGAAGKAMPLPYALAEVSGNKTGGRAYLLILLIAMISSALSAGYCLTTRIAGLLKKLSRANDREIWVASDVIICAVTVPAAGAGFMNLVAVFYPLYGLLGALYFLILTLRSVKIRHTA